MKITIIGIGAMGSLFAAHLSPLTQVTVIGHWPEQLYVLQRSGLNLFHPDGRSTHHQLHATDDLTAAAPADVALVLVKSRQTETAAKIAQTVLAPDGLAVTLQNGLGNRETLAQTLGEERVALGVTAQGATVMMPGRVRHAGHGPTYLARTPVTAVRLEALADLFNRAGLATELVHNVDSLMWGKLAVNAGINPLTALLKTPNGFLAQSGPARQVMMAAARETAVVADALGVPLPYDDAGKQALTVASATAGNKSSMLQDVLRGVPTEIEAICGAIVQNGRQAGISTPVNQQLHHLIKQAEREELQLSSDEILQSLLIHLPPSPDFGEES